MSHNPGSVDVARLRALIERWRVTEAADAVRRGYVEAGIQLQVCANDLEALLTETPAAAGHQP